MGFVAVVVRLMIVGVLGASMLWTLVATIDEPSPDARAPRRAPLRKGPDTKPVAPLHRKYVGSNLHMRGCECRMDWASLPAGTPDVCRCMKQACPAAVTPIFLTYAAGQNGCTVDTPTEYHCYVGCKPDGKIEWYGSPCGEGPNLVKCDIPIKGLPSSSPAPPSPAAAPPSPAAPAPAAAAGGDTRKLQANNWPNFPDERGNYLDLRGLQCELLDGKERCFYEDAQGREMCPPHVTSAFLDAGAGQWSCGAENSGKFYCTAGCQEGHEDVRWGAHEMAYCATAGDACPKRPIPVLKSSFKLQPWSGKPDPVTACQAAHLRGEMPPGPVPQLSVGMLTHEPKSMADSLKTYEDLGFFSVVSEFMVFINKRRPEVEDVLAPYVKAYPGKIKIMGDVGNAGIARGMSYLTGNASNPYFLFLERDFQLIEPATCFYEQLMAGIELIKAKKAHVVRYRHRRHPGRPNWAERMFIGHEDDAFVGRQPNLACNVFYWVENPEKRWPDKMPRCMETPGFWCSDSFYCNWTNNPQLWEVSWWNAEYVDKFPSFKRNDPYGDLEAYMNWEPNSWNDRKWTVAQGDGLFKHVDRNNFGIS